MIDSELPLPEFDPLPASDIPPDLRMRVGRVPRVRRKASLREEIAVNVVGAAFLIRGGAEVTVDADPGSDPAAVRMVLLGRVMAFLLRQRGWLPLHGSGVLTGAGCVLFLGASGAGKSTTAAAFVDSGYAVATDDVAAVRMLERIGCVVQPAWPHLRLHDDVKGILARSGLRKTLQIDKYRFDLNQEPIAGALKLARIYILEYGPELMIEPLDPLQATPLLSRHSFVRHRNMDRESLSVHLRQCTVTASAVPVRRLVRPRQLDALPRLVRLVEQDISAG